MLFTKNKHRNSYAFTLVELIVVITILVILGTIAFISLSGYSGSARDSSRVSDITNLSKSLDIAYIKTSMYPSPDNAFSVTYSGGVLWNQGVAGDGVMNIFSAAGAKLSKKLTDPLDVSKEYVYSRVAYGNAYQIKADYEADSMTQYVPKFSDTAFAASGKPALTYIKGNYNGIAAKTQTGGVVYLVATPSIITSQSGVIGSGYEITTVLPDKILFHGQTNSGGIIFTPKLVFSSSSLPSTEAQKILFATGIIGAYSGTILAGQSNIQTFIAATSNTTALANLGGALVSTELGGTNSVVPATPESPSSLCGSSKNQTVGYPSIATFQSNLCSASGSVLSWTGVGGTTGSDALTWTCKDTLNNTENCTANYAKFSQNSVTCNTSDILIGSLTGSYQVWAACNVGASLASTASGIVGADGNQTLLGTNEMNAVGYYFQWHRNDILAMDPSDGTLASTLTGTRSTVTQSSLTASAPAGITNLFIKASGSWRSAGLTTDSSWGQGPCQAGYHVPTGGTSTTSTEWGNAFVIMGTNYFALRDTLQLPYSGSRANATGAFGGQGINAWYGSASPFSAVGSYASLVYLSDVFPDISGNNPRSLGVSVRCIRD